MTLAWGNVSSIAIDHDRKVWSRLRTRPSYLLIYRNCLDHSKMVYSVLNSTFERCYQLLHWLEAHHVQVTILR